MTAHGFRSAASLLNESGLWNSDAIERQLAHVDNDSRPPSYELRRGGIVVALRQRVEPTFTTVGPAPPFRRQEERANLNP